MIDLAILQFLWKGKSRTPSDKKFDCSTPTVNYFRKNVGETPHNGT